MGRAGRRSIAPTGHVTMMAAVQPFLSGAISKTVNLPESATVEEIEQIYYDGWKLGLKALAVYRDNCKVGQPLSDSKAAPAAQSAHVTVVAAPAAPVRKRLPKSRPSITTSFRIGGAEGYLTAGSYPDDGLGEIFLRLGKQGSTLAGVMDAFSIAISIALQHGVPLETFVQKFTSLRFAACRHDRRQGRPDGAVDHGLHLPAPRPGLPSLRDPGRYGDLHDHGAYASAPDRLLRAG